MTECPNKEIGCISSSYVGGYDVVRGERSVTKYRQSCKIYEMMNGVTILRQLTKWNCANNS